MGNDVRRMLGPEEREEYDALMHDATHLADGKRRPSAEIGPEARRLLLDAEQAQKEWAGWVRSDAEVDGLRRKALAWVNSREIVQTTKGEMVVSRAAARGIKVADDEGVTYHQQMLWQDMGDEELRQVLVAGGGRIAAERDNIAKARALLDLLDRTHASIVSEALTAVGMTLEEFFSAAESA